MSIDRSLKTASSLQRHRNVLSRAERVAKLTEKGNFDPASGDPLGLPKVAHRKIVTGAKTSKKEKTEEAAKK